MDNIQQMQRVVVTGATSMIGVSLLDALITDQNIEKIYTVIRPNSEKKYRLPEDKRIEIIECDISDYCDLPKRIGKNCDVFYHLAWPRTSTYDETLEDMLVKVSNIQAVLMSVNAAAELGCRRYVGAGGQSEYGVLKSERYSPESACWPVRADGITHLAAGLLAKRLANGGG